MSGSKREDYSNLKVEEVPRNGKNRHLFRQVSRDSSGAVFDPPEDEVIFMIYIINQARGNILVGVGSCLAADPKLEQPGPLFLSEYYHSVSYLFIKSKYKDSGFGSKLLSYIEEKNFSSLKRPIRVQAAEKAVGFFIKHGYKMIGEPVNTVCAGSPLFSRLCNMEKPL